jgi:hypothetical protein
MQFDIGHAAIRFVTFTLVLLISGLLPVISSETQLELGSVAVARDPTGSVLGTDSTQILDKLIEFARDQDEEAVKELTREGHLFGIKSGSEVEILSFDPAEHAYKVRLIGSNKEIWLIKETISAN